MTMTMTTMIRPLKGKSLFNLIIFLYLGGGGHDENMYPVPKTKIKNRQPKEYNRKSRMEFMNDEGQNK